MDNNIKNAFMEKWGKYFPGAELPLAFYYLDDSAGTELIPSPRSHQCVIANLSKARQGKNLSFNSDSLGCFGAKRYFGFSNEVMPNFEYFLSYGIPGKLEGERYIKSPEMVKESFKHQPEQTAGGKYLVSKRWDRLDEKDNPDVVVFFAHPDVISGLFTLANYDHGDPYGVVAPFAAGCSSILAHAYRESKSERPRAVLGMFDVSARPCVKDNEMSFSIPMNKFERMVANMDESFLITESWKKVAKRIKKSS